MGNTLCRHKAAAGGLPQDTTNTTTTSSLKSPFDRLIARVQLCPSALHRNSGDPQKRTINRYDITPMPSEKQPTKIIQTPAKTEPSDWKEASLVVPADDPPRHKDKIQFAELINSGTPIPPPRRHRQKLRENLETVTRNELNAMFSSRPTHTEPGDRIPVEEPVCVRATVKKHICKGDEERFHKHHNKHHSTVSLPNINELQLSIPRSADDATDQNERSVKPNQRPKTPPRNVSAISLPGENKRVGKLENYMTRCRSFGSLLPHNLLDKLKIGRRITNETAESDDSWGGLDDWDLAILEHYKPQDSSLPRPMNKGKPPTLTDTDHHARPVPPVRKSDSFLRRSQQLDHTNENNDQATKLLSSDDDDTKSNNNLVEQERLLAATQPVSKSILKIVNVTEKESNDNHEKPFETTRRSSTTTPPPSPEPQLKDTIIIHTTTDPLVKVHDRNNLQNDNDHSSLMKLITEITQEDKIKKSATPLLLLEDTSATSSMTPSLTELEAALSDFLEDTTNADDRRASLNSRNNMRS